MVAEALFFLWIGWSRFGLGTNNTVLYTFSFLTLLYFAVFSVVSARERRSFWRTKPSTTLMAALVADALTGTVLTFVGIKDLMPLPWWQMLAIFGYAMIACLVVNDALKVAMIKWLVPAAVAKKPVDLAPQIAKRAYELYEQRGRGDGQAVQDWGHAEQEVRKAEAKAEPKPEAKPEPKPEAKAEPKPEAKVKTPSDLAPQIAKRAYELYEQRGRGDGQAVQDWGHAEQEIRKAEAKAEPKAEAKAEPKPEPHK